MSFILIIQIVLVHSNNLSYFHSNKEYNGTPIAHLNSFIQYSITDGLARTALPLFFIISGYLFFQNIQDFNFFIGFYRYKLSKRFYTLTIPYLFWSFWGIITYIIFLLGRAVLLNTELLWPFSNIFDFLKIIFINPIPGQLWYIRELILYALSAPILLILIKKFKIFLILIFFIMWFFNIDLLNIISEKGLFFYCLGAYGSIFIKEKFASIDIRIPNNIRKFLPVMWIFSIISYALNKIFFQFEIDIYLMNLSICFGIIPTWNIYELLKERTKCKIYNFSKNTFIIYAAHLPTIGYFYRIIRKLSLNGYSILIVYFMVPITVVLILDFIGNLLNTYLPNIYKLITGNRNKNKIDYEYKLNYIKSFFID